MLPTDLVDTPHLFVVNLLYGMQLTQRWTVEQMADAVELVYLINAAWDDPVNGKRRYGWVDVIVLLDKFQQDADGCSKRPSFWDFKAESNEDYFKAFMELINERN